MTTTNEALFRRWHDDIWNARNVDAVDELMAADGILHDTAVSGAPRISRDEFKAQARALQSAFPDLHFVVEQVVDGGDHVATRVTITGTHAGPGLGVAPTGRPFRIGGMSIGRVRDGRIVEGWNNVDFLGLFTQLGLVARPAVEPSLD
ncbi:MAG TPA: ester cyclase [Candidatus Binatia bacterium]|jgi:steroid delta-isomerase-like uncharacterized protein|nr:ester cyclase [Candidatus Binatia bacterium]